MLDIKKSSTVETEFVYRGKAKEYLTSHALIDFMRNPAIFQMKREGLLQVDFDSEAFAFGTACHVLLLQGEEEFRRQFQTVGAPVNPTNGKPYGANTKAFRNWKINNGVISYLPDEQVNEVRRIVQSSITHPIAGRIFNTGFAERVFRAEVRGVKCQIKPDWVTGNSIIEYKTCKNLDFFWNDGPDCDVKRYKYLIQGAFYSMVLNSINEGDPFDFSFVATEKERPNFTGVFPVDQKKIEDIIEHDIIPELDRMRQCEGQKHFENYYDHPIKIEKE